MSIVQRRILNPDMVYGRSDVLGRSCPIPPKPGIYAWYFREIPPAVPTAGCHMVNGMPLLYIGISPRRHTGERISKQNIRKRIQYHYRGNAEGSTLRLTLGCLLGLELRRVGSGKRMTFGKAGEATLSDWMDANSFVVWEVLDEPWEFEHSLIDAVKTPLNIEGSTHPFRSELSRIRTQAKALARGRGVIE